jgi:DNA-binding transcriptional ArsR family regulator
VGNGGVISSDMSLFKQIEHQYSTYLNKKPRRSYTHVMEPTDIDDWMPVEAEDPFVDFADLDHLELLDELTHRVRGPLLRRLRSPHSAAELADEMGVPVTRLYHHLSVLESAGLIRVVATRRVGAATERRYRAIAHGFRIRPDLVEDPAIFARSVGVVIDAARAELLESAERGRCGVDDAAMWSVRMRLDRQQQAELVERMGALIAEFEVSGRESGSTDEVQVLALAFPL